MQERDHNIVFNLISRGLVVILKIYKFFYLPLYINRTKLMYTAINSQQFIITLNKRNSNDFGLILTYL